MRPKSPKPAPSFPSLRVQPSSLAQQEAAGPVAEVIFPSANVEEARAEQSAAFLYVSTDLYYFEDADPLTLAVDVVINQRVYRRMDGAYYVWLYLMVSRATAAHKAGKLDDATYITLHGRWLVIQRLAKLRYSEQSLKDALAQFNVKQYQPPRVKLKPKPIGEPKIKFLYPQEGDYKFDLRVSAHAMQEVDNIREYALKCGWTMEELYTNRSQTRYPLGDWGLICHVNEDDKISTVTERYVEIETGVFKFKSRFYRRKLTIERQRIDNKVTETA